MLLFFCGCLQTSFSRGSFLLAAARTVLTVWPDMLISFWLLQLLGLWVGPFVFYVQWRCTRRPHFSLLCAFCLIVLVSVMTVMFSLSVSVQGWACGGSLFFLLGLSLFAWLPWQLSYFLFWFEGESLRSFCPLVHASYSPSLSVWIHPSILPRGWSPRWLAPKCIFHPRDTVQADSL